jgi:RimJ/RimL family protein N-acetyltransferase
LRLRLIVEITWQRYAGDMNITFRPTDYSIDSDCEAIARWKNNPVLQRLWVPIKNSSATQPIVTAAQVREEHMGPPSPFTPVVDELAILGNRIVGQFTLIINPPHRRSSADIVAWPSVVIGEDSLRGRGLIRRFGDRIFAAARKLGATHLEAGVFEFNAPIRRLLEKAEFTEFARVENMTFQDGRRWADMRYQRLI